MNHAHTLTLDDLNALSSSDARDWLAHTCASPRWCALMDAGRPFGSEPAVLEMATRAWSQCGEADYLEAFAAHPMIGDISTLKAKFANTQALASAEQSGTAAASDETLTELHALNQQYLAQNGFIFIICATGLAADTMLAALKARIGNDRHTELAIAAAEQLKITRLRLKKALLASPVHSPVAG